MPSPRDSLQAGLGGGRSLEVTIRAQARLEQGIQDSLISGRGRSSMLKYGHDGCDDVGWPVAMANNPGRV